MNLQDKALSKPPAASIARRARLADKVAVITGAASGIGKEIALLFAREGARIAIADLDQGAAEATAREIDASGKRAIGVAMDVADEDQVEAGIARGVETIYALRTLGSKPPTANVRPLAPL